MTSSQTFAGSVGAAFLGAAFGLGPGLGAGFGSVIVGCGEGRFAAGFFGWLASLAVRLFLPGSPSKGSERRPGRR